ncbi:MAG: META domain-containing protein [Saprospiraceae bacterium]|nr:META domain-containing protein [Saprospiraceae bacterium]
MKALLYVCLLLSTCFSLQSCFGVGGFETAEEEAQELRNTKWILDEKEAFSPTLLIADNLENVSGETGCNSYSADLLLKNYSFEINTFIKTEMFCDQYDEDERNYFINLSNAVQFRILHEDVLLLKNQIGKVILRYKKIES